MPTVQEFLNSIGSLPYQNAGSSDVPQYMPLSSVGDTQQMLGTPLDFYGGLTPQQHLTQFGVTDPMNQLDYVLPEPREGSLMPAGDDLMGFMLALAPVAGMLSSWAPGMAGAGEGAFMGAGVDPVVAADAAAGTPMFGEAPFMGAGVDPVTAADAAQGTSMFETSSGLPSLPPGAGSAAQSLVKALTGGNAGNVLSSGVQGFMQGATPGGQSYMRKARAPLSQPAFLGSGEQQALGSTEDMAFNQALGERREDVSNRSRQMAAQIRGRPGLFAWKG